MTDTERKIDLRGRPRPAFLVALAGAAITAWALQSPPPPAPAPVAAAPVEAPAIVDTLHPDQTLSDVWVEHDLPAEDLHPVVEAGQGVASWRTLRPGSVYQIRLEPDGRLKELDVQLDRDRRMIVARAGDGFLARLHETKFTRTSRRLSACVDGSLWQAVSEKGEDPALTIRMAEILAAQVDFYTDIHEGDCFDLAFTADERPDGSYRIASVDAIRLEASGVEHQAYRFDAEGGDAPAYYDAEGQSLKRRFLRSPLKYTRISSRFGMRRHPILRKMRVHHGVDYAAPVGTPVQAAGDGVVLRAGRHGGYGIEILLKHGSRYETGYGHLSKIASGIRTGVHVRQGQVIGYVGSTGLATGPHLDYRFMKDGKYVDPLSTNLPTAPPLAGPALVAFAARRDSLRARLGTTWGDALARDRGGPPAAGR